MAPRSVKNKKAADENIISDLGPKKSRSKAKVVKDIELELAEPEVIEKVATEKKPKRGKKVVESNGEEKTNANGKVPVKKGRKKNVPEIEKENGNSNSENGESPVPVEEKDIDTNGDIEEAAEPSSKKKRGGKKEPVDKPDTKLTKGKKNANQEETSQTENGDVEKAKPAAKGKGRKAQPKAEKTENSDDEAKTVPITGTKSRKKAAKPKSPVPEELNDAEETPSEPETKPVTVAATKGRKKTAKPKLPEPALDEPVDDEETPSEPEKKPVKGKKGQSKKAKAEDKPEEEPSTKKRKPNKEEKGQGDTNENQVETTDEPKPKSKRGQKKTPEVAEESEETEDSGEPNTKRKRKPADDKAPAEEKKKAPLKNKSETNYDEIDFTNTSTNPQGKESNFKISSWNVDGIRAWITKGGLDYIKYEKPDILCLQEVKCSKEKLPEEAENLPGYHGYWLCSDKDGYAGVAVYTAKLAMNVQYGLQDEDLDSEGRIITAEYEHFYLICTYVPNAGRKLVTLPKRLQWNDAFRRHVKELDKKKPVIICGDMNVAHNEIDLANPKTNKKNAGFTEEERSGMTDLLGDGFVDTYRQLNPEKTGAYTFWTYMMGARAKNVGWRLDYFIVSERLLPLICDSVIRDQVYGSDHCPISLLLHLTTADKPKESP